MTDDRRTVCSICNIRQQDEEFRDPTIDPSCCHCGVRHLDLESAASEVRHLSDDERAALDRDEQDHVRRVKEGHVPTAEEWPEVYARRAALAGVSVTRYKSAEESIFIDAFPMFGIWLVIYLLAAIFVSVFAIAHGLGNANLFRPEDVPPQLLQVFLTILLIVVWPFLWYRFVGSGFYADLAFRSELADRSPLLFLQPAHLLSGILVPVLMYVIVLIVVP